MSLLSELKRRNVFRMSVLYLVVAWLIMQVAEVVVTLAALPDWTGRLVLSLLAVGLPIALAFSWFYELTPEGISLEKDVAPGESITHITGRRLDFIVISLLCAAVIAFAYDKWWTVPPPELSIAILPFKNMSDDPDQEYFSDGISEELLNVLSRIPELTVISRSSAFSFKDKSVSTPMVAKQLNVAHVLEGSVRKSGNRVRITAQLIKASSDSHLWSESYDRALDDIFVIQDEIASKVAKALEVTLIGKPQADRMIDPEAYALYLKGRYFEFQSGAANHKKAEEALLQAIELEPGYAEAWAALAMAYYDQTNHKIKTREEGAALAKHAIARAKKLDPELGVAWGVDGFLKKNFDQDWGAAQTAINRAYELDPKNNRITIWRASMYTTIGELDYALELYQQALLNDPLNLSTYSALGHAYAKVHRYDEAIEVFEKQAELKRDYYWVYFNLCKSYLFKGNPEQALLEIKKNPENMFRIAGLVMAYSALGREAEADKALRRLASEYGTLSPDWIAEAYGWRGQKDEAFEWLEKAFMQRSIGLSYLLGNNVYYSLTNDSRWEELLKKTKLFEYWQAMPPEYGGPTKPPG